MENSFLRNNKELFSFVVFVFIILNIYLNTWLPLAKIFLYTYEFLSITTAFFIVLFFIKIKHFNLSLLRFVKNNLFILSTLGILFISMILFNNQEIFVLKNLISLISLLSYLFIFFVFVPTNILITVRDFDIFLTRIWYLALVIAFFGLFFFSTGIGHKNTGLITTASFYLNPNYAPPLYLSGILCGLYIYYSKKEETTLSRKMVLLISISFLIISMIFTYSRNGIIAMIFGIIFFLFLVHRFRILYFIPIVVVISLVSFNVLFVVKGISSFSMRLYLLIPAYNMITENSLRLLWGYGYSNNYKVYEAYKVYIDVLNQQVTNPHNSYFSIIMMFGIVIGILIFLFVLTNLFKSFKHYFSKKNPEINHRLVLVIAGIISMLSLGIFESQLVMPFFLNSELLMVFIGLIYFSQDGDFFH